jgi:hypothetical protein
VGAAWPDPARPSLLEPLPAGLWDKMASTVVVRDAHGLLDPRRAPAGPALPA